MVSGYPSSAKAVLRVPCSTGFSKNSVVVDPLLNSIPKLSPDTPKAMIPARMISPDSRKNQYLLLTKSNNYFCSLGFDACSSFGTPKSGQDVCYIGPRKKTHKSPGDYDGAEHAEQYAYTKCESESHHPGLC